MMVPVFVGATPKWNCLMYTSANATTEEWLNGTSVNQTYQESKCGFKEQVQWKCVEFEYHDDFSSIVSEVKFAFKAINHFSKINLNDKTVAHGLLNRNMFH